MLVNEMRPRVLAAGMSVVLLSALSFALAAPALAETAITASNSSDNVDTQSGDATVINNNESSTGQFSEGEAANTQAGDTTSDNAQDATTDSGAAISGQVIGGVSEDDLSINATNSAVDSTAFTGESLADNNADIFVGLIFGDEEGVDTGFNLSEGEIDGTLAQNADSNSGDAVGGQWIGAQSYNGTADIVLANTTENVQTGSGESEQDNVGDLDVGEFIFTVEV
jgi:hypothetical protein